MAAEIFRSSEQQEENEGVRGLKGVLSTFF
jgi:hypothetical protein